MAHATTHEPATDARRAGVRSALLAPLTQQIVPQFIALPQHGRDAHFNLCRSSWYALERTGTLRLIRLVHPGKKRGKVLIPVAEAREAILRLGARGSVARAAS